MAALRDNFAVAVGIDASTMCACGAPLSKFEGEKQ
jgi:hypothetical protein